LTVVNLRYLAEAVALGELAALHLANLLGRDEVT
jgi:hypothetical protein